MRKQSPAKWAAYFSQHIIFSAFCSKRSAIVINSPCMILQKSRLLPGFSVHSVNNLFQFRVGKSGRL
ncbi:TPA: hypothetical protein ACXZU9_005000, partial [Salmonella enterica]